MERTVMRPLHYSSLLKNVDIEVIHKSKYFSVRKIDLRGTRLNCFSFLLPLQWAGKRRGGGFGGVVWKIFLVGRELFKWNLGGPI